MSSPRHPFSVVIDDLDLDFAEAQESGDSKEVRDLGVGEHSIRPREPRERLEVGDVEVARGGPADAQFCGMGHEVPCSLTESTRLSSARCTIATCCSCSRPSRVRELVSKPLEKRYVPGPRRPAQSYGERYRVNTRPRRGPVFIQEVAQQVGRGRRVG